MSRFNPILIFISIQMILFFVITNTVLSSCAIPPPNEPEFKLPTIKTDKQKSTLCLAPQYMMNAWYDLECLRPFCTEFDPDKTYADTMKTHQFWEPTIEEKQSHSNKGLLVIVDTIHEITMTKRPIWANYLFHRSFDDNRPLLQDDTLIQDVKSFPVYFANVSDTKIASIEMQDGSFLMIVEALDEHHTWRAIEYWSHSWCGNSYYSLDIPPQYFAFTRGVKCSGDFLTSCRLKVFNGEDSLYSNTFKMSINTNQFHQPLSTKER